MPSFGYSLMCEPYDPNELLAQAARAEAAGFDFITISDHFHPWLVSHHHSPYAWTVLGALARSSATADAASSGSASAVILRQACTPSALAGSSTASRHATEHVDQTKPSRIAALFTAVQPPCDPPMPPPERFRSYGCRFALQRARALERLPCK
jgi:hypothetical protein